VTKETIKKERNEMKTTEDTKKVLNKDMENLRKKEWKRNPGNTNSFQSNKETQWKATPADKSK
jgi:hypothetical protein